MLVHAASWKDRAALKTQARFVLARRLNAAALEEAVTAVNAQVRASGHEHAAPRASREAEAWLRRALDGLNTNNEREGLA
jgi:hypothetical protein